MHVVADLPQRVVVPQQHHQRAVEFLDGGGQFLRGVEKTAVAHQHQAGSLRCAEFGSDTRWQAVTEGAVAGGVQPAAGAVAGKRIVAGVGQLGHVAADEGVDGHRGGDAVENALVQSLQFAVASPERSVQSSHGVNCFNRIAHGAGHARQQCTQRLQGIAVQGDGTGVEVVELARVDVDADHFATDRQALAPVIGVCHFGADRQHHVGLRDQIPTRLHAQAGSGIQGRIGCQQTFAGDAGEQRRGEAIAQGSQLGPGGQRTTAGDDHRPLGVQQSPGCLVEGFGSGQATSGAAHHLATPVPADRPRQHIQRHRNMHRPWPLAIEHGEGAGNQFGQIVGAQGDRRKRGDGRGDRPLILGFVQATPPFTEAGGVVDAGNHQHRNRIGVGLADGGRRIGDAGAGDDEAHPRLATDPGVAVGHEPGALLMPSQHMANAAAGQAAIQLEGVDTGDAEHGIDPVMGQQAHQCLATCEGRG
ncbi:hypothetical protein D3C73_586060 [compost metagenome]